MNAHIKTVKTQTDFAYCIALRALVYVHEQKCPINEEYDSYEESAQHYLMTIDNHPVATARYRMINDGTAKIERIVVLTEQRGKGFGKDMVQHVENDIMKKPSVEKIIMSAQDYALTFYKKLGYTTIEGGYMEAGIPHHKIEKNITKGKENGK